MKSVDYSHNFKNTRFGCFKRMVC